MAKAPYDPEYHRQYRERNKERLRIAAAERMKDPEIAKAREEYLARTRKERLIKKKKYREEHHDHAAQYMREYRAKNGPAFGQRQRKYITGHSPEYFIETLKAQNFTCALCPTHLNPNVRTTHADHDHATGKPRGVLCHKCNTALGYIEKRPHLCQPTQVVKDYLARYVLLSSGQE